MVNEIELLKREVAGIEAAIEGSIVESQEVEKTLGELDAELMAVMDKARAIREEMNKKRQALNLIDRENRDRTKQKELRLNRIKVEQDKIEASKGLKESILKRRLWAESQEFPWAKAAMPHQWEGALTLSHFGNAMLADEMGLGKTLTSIAYLDMLDNKEGDGFGAKNVLIVVPSDMVSEFTRELGQWAPHRSVIPCAGPNPFFRKMVTELMLSVGNATIVTNYESLWREHEWVSQLEWDAVIIDEFHNAKDSKGITFNKLKEISSRFWLPMTATFILNSPEDIFPALNLILPEAFDDIEYFRRNYCRMGYDSKWRFQEGGEKALMEAVGTRLVKRSLKDAEIELPQKLEHEVLIPRSAIDPKQIEAMREIDEALINIGDDSYPITAAIAQITRRRQASVYPAGIEIKMTQSDYDAQELMGMSPLPVGTVLASIPKDVPSIKIDMAVQRLVKVIKSGKRAVVFSQFKTALTELDERLKAEGIRSIRYDGDTPKSIRNDIKKDFKRTNDERDNEPSKWDVVLCNYKTGGVGLTLTRATYMLKLDDEWNPGKEDQSTRRIYRIGQTEPVLIETLRIDQEKGHPSIDLWMRDLIALKKSIVDGLDAEVSVISSFREVFAKEEKPAPSAISAEEIDSLLDGIL